MGMNPFRKSQVFASANEGLMFLTNTIFSYSDVY